MRTRNPHQGTTSETVAAMAGEDTQMINHPKKKKKKRHEDERKNSRVHASPSKPSSHSAHPLPAQPVEQEQAPVP